MSKINTYISKSNLAIIIIGVFALAFIFTVRWNGTSGQNYQNIIRGDGEGYYNYFPAFLNGEIYNQQANSTFLNKVDSNKVVNKYSIGTALVISPFVIPTYFIQKTCSTEVDFYSEYFQKSVSIAAFFYLILGLIFLRKLLLLYKLETRTIAFSIFAIFFGTNLAYYSLLEPSMSHIYSFAFISIFSFLVKKFSLKANNKTLFLVVIALAIITLIRPVNIIILFAIPLLIGNNTKLLINWLSNNTKTIIYAFIIFLAIIFVQLIAWYIQTGSFIIWSYNNEGFYFSKPEILNFLFSFRKGFFIYTPFALLAITIFIISFRKSRSFLIKAILFLLFIFYILSSWWNWYYGDSFSSRVMIDFLPIIALLFAISLDRFKIIGQRIIVIFAFILVLLNIFQSYQYYYNIMSRYDMNFEKYKFVFGKFDTNNSWILGGNQDIIQYHKQEPQILINESIEAANTSFRYAIKGKELMNYSSSFIELSCNSKLINGDMSKAYFRLSHISASGNEFILGGFKINEIPLEIGQKRMNSYSIRIPKPISADDKFILEIQDPFNSEFIISDIEVKVSGIKSLD